MLSIAPLTGGSSQPPNASEHVPCAPSGDGMSVYSHKPKRWRSLDELRQSVVDLVTPPSLALVPVGTRELSLPELSPIDELRVKGATVEEGPDINPRGVNDCQIIVPVAAGDERKWTFFRAGQDSLAQAAELFCRSLRADMREGRSKQLIIGHDTVDASIMERLLRAIYFTPVTPDMGTALEMRSVIDYLCPTDSPNPVLRTIAAECDKVMIAGITRDNAEAIFLRAVAVSNEQMQTRAIQKMDLGADFRLRAANYSEQAMRALVSNSALKLSEPEPEAQVVDLLWHWAQAHSEEPDVASQAELLRAARLVRCVRWVAVREPLIWQSYERGLLNDADAGRILRARVLKTTKPDQYESFKLFDEAIIPARA